METIWTIGHSTRSLDELLSLLKAYSIELLVDVRSLPGSRKFPYFNKENLEVELPVKGILYEHFADLGGRRRARKDSHNIAWHNASFKGYADYMETPQFLDSLESLKDISRKKKTCIMCSEAVWWRCHRSMVADILKAQGWTVNHIMSLTKFKEHIFTAPAKIVDGKLSYH